MWNKFKNINWQFWIVVFVVIIAIVARIIIYKDHPECFFMPCTYVIGK